MQKKLKNVTESALQKQQLEFYSMKLEEMAHQQEEIVQKCEKKLRKLNRIKI